MLRKIFLFAFAAFFLINKQVSAQAALNTTGAPPDPQAMLDVKSTTKGFLPPRLTTAQRNTLAATLSVIQTGLQVADNPSGKIYSWTGTKWVISGYSATSPLNLASTNSVALNSGTAAGDLITWDGNNWISTQPAPLHFLVAYDNRQPYLTLNYCIATQGVFPSRSSDEPFVGEIQVFGFNFPPQGYSFCDGSILSINTNTALFSLLGTFYGGNGVNTFALPDLRGRLPIRFGQGPGLTDRPIGESAGTEINNLTH